MKVGDVRVFNEAGRDALCWPGIKNGEKVVLTRVGRAYKYDGLRPGILVREVDLKLVGNGSEYEYFSSQYVGYTEEEMEDF